MDGWLIIDKKGNNPIFERFFPNKPWTTRPILLFDDLQGRQELIVYKIEEEVIHHLHKLPFRSVATTKELEELLKNRYKARTLLVDTHIVDHETCEWLKSLGITIKPSLDEIQFRFRPTEKGRGLHWIANQKLEMIIEEIKEYLVKKRLRSEQKILNYILKRFLELGLETLHPPIVAVNQNSSLPHYSALDGIDTPIKPHDLLLIDLFAKEKDAEAVYADRTFMFLIGRKANNKEERALNAIIEARDKAYQALSFNKSGSEIDQISREVLINAGFEKNILHRLGHSIDQELHGVSMNLDSIEVQEKRKPIEGLCLSIEPALYFPNEFGIRIETNLLIDETGKGRWTSKPQNEFILI